MLGYRLVNCGKGLGVKTGGSDKKPGNTSDRSIPAGIIGIQSPSINNRPAWVDLGDKAHILGYPLRRMRDSKVQGIHRCIGQYDCITVNITK